jgi:hypothetical protein
MKIVPSHRSTDGVVLVTTLVIALLVALVVGAVLLVGQRQNYLSSRSATWCSEIPIAEAGIEEAMAHINSRPPSYASRGWQRISGTTKVYQQRTIGNGYYYTTITTTKPPVIVSVGYARIPLRETNFTSRTVMAITRLMPPPWGIVGKSSVSFNGNPFVDSYNSSDTNFSTNGKWDINKRRDRAGVATLSTNAGGINTGSNGEIYGSAATGPGGTVIGTVGDGDWLAAGNTGLESGHVTDDFNMAVPPVSLPSPWNPQTTPLLNQIINTVTYNMVLSAGDWQLGNTSITAGKGIYIQGPARLYVNGNLKITGNSGGPAITLAPGATLEMYIGGSMDLKGDGVINPGGVPANCKIYGLPTCTEMDYAGTAQVYCQMYAPNADINITGDFDFSGSVVGNRVSFSGNAAIHYDEALGGDRPEYNIASWEEL